MRRVASEVSRSGVSAALVSNDLDTWIDHQSTQVSGKSLLVGAIRGSTGSKRCWHGGMVKPLELGQLLLEAQHSDKFKL